MRKLTLLLASAALGTCGLVTVLPASAAVLSVAQVTNGCPDIDQARECPALAEQFLSDRPAGPVSDGQIVTLVVSIAELAQVPRVTLPVCLNAADGLRVLAGGVSTESQQTQIEDIADSLCDGSSTASIRRGELTDTLAGTSSGEGLVASGPGTGAGGDTTDDGDDATDEGDDGTDDGDDGTDDGDSGTDDGLGSNDASAGQASQNGEDHANENAVTNTHGNNGN